MMRPTTVVNLVRHNLVLTVVCAGIAATVIAGPAAAWPNAGPAWTKQQARAALLDARRIVAEDAMSLPFAYNYTFQIVRIDTLRGSGPVVAGAKWRRFEVAAVIDLLIPIPERGGIFAEPPTFATFCLHVGRNGNWRITGFDQALAYLSHRIPKNLGCADNAAARKAVGAPYR